VGSLQRHEVGLGDHGRPPGPHPGHDLVQRLDHDQLGAVDQRDHRVGRALGTLDQVRVDGQRQADPQAGQDDHGVRPSAGGSRPATGLAAPVGSRAPGLRCPGPDVVRPSEPDGPAGRSCSERARGHPEGETAGGERPPPDRPPPAGSVSA
jgi:hypothetical protein